MAGKTHRIWLILMLLIAWTYTTQFCPNVNEDKKNGKKKWCKCPATGNKDDPRV